MGPIEVLLYLSGALAYGILSMLALSGVARLVGWPLSVAHMGLGVATFFVIFLGLHPFPDPAKIDCTGAAKQILLRPFGFLDRFTQLWRMNAPLDTWMRDLTVSSSIMNFVFFAGVGVLAARVLPTRTRAVAFAILLSGFIEFAQGTALFGLYSCPYRQVDVDDLILNIAGVIAGFVFGRRLH